MLYEVITIGGGSNALGLFHAFIQDKDVRMVGIEAAGKGLNTSLHGASISKGKKGVLHGMLSYFLQDEDGQIEEAYSISARITSYNVCYTKLLRRIPLPAM